jgi:hypothetical protein
MANLSGKELSKYTYRPQKLAEMIENKKKIEVDKVGRVILEVSKSDLTTLKEAKSSDTEYSKIQFWCKEKGVTYRLTQLVKTKEEFGGLGAGATTIAERAALTSLKKQIQDIKNTTLKPYVKIKVGTEIYEVDYAEEEKNKKVKSDFNLIDSSGKICVWISHKDGTSFDSFRQWGGLSADSEPDIHKDPETQAFIKTLKELYKDGVPRGSGVKRSIKKNTLKGMSMYGNKYGGSKSNQNVSIVLQGDITLKKQSNNYELTAYHTQVNGYMPTDDYEPVFVAYYTSSRNDLGFPATSFSTAPAPDSGSPAS